MPYISIEKRDEVTLSPELRWAETPGELAFQITDTLLDYKASNAVDNYSGYATLIGVLETVKLELYRRLIAPYEDRKAEENGDVY